MELKKVLIIENDKGMAHSVIEDFKKKGVEIAHAIDDRQVNGYLKEQFQMVILDWHLEVDDNTSSVLARLCLEIIKQHFFIPVVIWTGELAAFKAEEIDVYKIFPQAMIHAYSKDDVKFDNLLQLLNEWHKLPPLSFAEDLRRTITLSTEIALYSLAEHSHDQLAAGFKTLIQGESAPQADVEHIVQVFTRLIEREIYRDKEFVSAIRKTVEQLSLANVPTTKAGRENLRRVISSIQELYMFYQSPSDDIIVRSGDYIDLDVSSENKSFLRKAIVITPACDLANPGKTLYLRLALVEEILPENINNKLAESEWDFKDDGKHLKVCFHQLFILKNDTLAASKEKPKFVMSYSHNYKTLNDDQVRAFKRIKRLAEPYLSDLLHSFVSHAGRIGQPDFSAATAVGDE